MSGTPTILPLIADSQKHAVNPADSATRTHASIATTKAQEENRESTTAPILDFFPQDITLHQGDRSQVESNRSPPLSSSTTENLLQNDKSPVDSDRSPEENNFVVTTRSKSGEGN
ncbi:hypothetical protein L3X38_043187 [Prunus dulcis]|uniref:Uncharacterized protein n=1 Tax=Prunus dulcis TaxID=3755 RepID=A0AAD4UY38_PRUDU|nr:hypothetical protein L3X38_043187 [Prunus dulcis]